MTEKEKLEAQKRLSGEEKSMMAEQMERAQGEWTQEKRDLQVKIQELVLHNDKVKDDCLKKVIAYKDKYTDYKNKVRQANQQIQTLMNAVAKLELEKEQLQK